MISDFQNSLATIELLLAVGNCLPMRRRVGENRWRDKHLQPVHREAWQFEAPPNVS